VEYTALGSTQVSRIVLGCAGFGGIGSEHSLIGAGERYEEAAAIMDRAWELGITTFDTADAYGGGASESAIGRWTKSRGTRPVLATKTYHPMGPEEDSGLAPPRIRRQLHGSLRRLGVESVELYLTHQPDPDTALDDTLDALESLHREGLIGAYGGSHLDAELLRAADGRYGWVQNSYSLLDRSDEQAVLPSVERDGLGYTPFSPLSGGWLTGKYVRDSAAPAGSRMARRPAPYVQLDREEVWRGLERFRGRAAEYGVEMATLAYAWVLGSPHVTALLVGPRRPEQLDAAVRALDVHLAPPEREELAALFCP